MSSRREQRQRARAERLARERRLAERAKRAGRLNTFSIISGIAGVVVVSVILLSSGASPASSNPGPLSGPRLAVTEHAVDSLLNGIPESGKVLGDPGAKVTMIYYGDLECPVCRAFTLLVFPTFVRQEVRTGKVNVDYRSLCTATCGPSLTTQAAESLFTKQQVAAYAAGRQHRFWYYAELFYHQQGQEDSGYVTEGYLDALAGEAGLRLGPWQSARTDPILASEVAADQAAATRNRIRATPTLVMQGPKGSQVVTGTYDGTYAFPGPATLARAVQAVS